MTIPSPGCWIYMSQPPWCAHQFTWPGGDGYTTPDAYTACLTLCKVLASLRNTLCRTVSGVSRCVLRVYLVAIRCPLRALRRPLYIACADSGYEYRRGSPPGEHPACHLSAQGRGGRGSGV